MTIDELFFSRLSDAAGGLYALVNTRIYPVKLPQGFATPAVVWQRITGTRESAFGSDPGLVHALIQLEGYATSFASARTIADAIRGRLQRWRSSGPPIVQDCFIETETDDYDETSGLAGTGLFRVRMEVRLHYQE